MRKVEMKVCKKCKGLYRFESGGIILSPMDQKDDGLCEECRAKKSLKINLKRRLTDDE